MQRRTENGKVPKHSFKTGWDFGLSLPRLGLPNLSIVERSANSFLGSSLYAVFAFNLEVTHDARFALKQQEKPEGLELKISDCQVIMGSILAIFALRALNPTFAPEKLLVGMNESLPNVLGGEYNSNHTFLSTLKGPLESEKYFFTFFSQKWANFAGIPRLEEGISGENNGVDG